MNNAEDCSLSVKMATPTKNTGCDDLVDIIKSVVSKVLTALCHWKNTLMDITINNSVNLDPALNLQFHNDSKLRKQTLRGKNM